MMSCMVKDLSITLSITWLPTRFPVRWTKAWEPPPVWGAIPGKNGVRLTTISYEAFQALEPQEQVRTLEEMESGVPEELLNRAGSEFHPEDMTPRLVWLWPGRVEFFLETFKIVSHGVGEMEWRMSPQWKRRGSVANAISSLYPYFIGKKKNATFQDKVLEVVHKHAQLHPERGDTLSEWSQAVTQIEFLSRLEALTSFLMSQEEKAVVTKEDVESVLMDIWKQVENGSPYSRIRQKIKGLESVAHIVCDAMVMREINMGALALLSPLGFRERLATALRSIVRGELLHHPSGWTLQTGALNWAMLELAERLSVQSSRRCVICNKALTGRRDAQTCPKSACKMEAHRRGLTPIKNKKLEREKALTLEQLELTPI